tara:strand:- start:6399 stop:6596 length:198 start_codon:yes stop_codon:yes gene_type:complete
MASFLTSLIATLRSNKRFEVEIHETMKSLSLSTDLPVKNSETQAYKIYLERVKDKISSLGEVMNE